MGQTSSGAFDGSGTGVFHGGAGLRTITCEYNFARHGGAVSSIVIGRIPNGATMIDGDLNVITVPVGAGASIGVTAQSAGDVVAVAAIVGAPWSSIAANLAIVPKIATMATHVTMTQARDVVAVISGAPLTAGRFIVTILVRNAA